MQDRYRPDAPEQGEADMSRHMTRGLSRRGLKGIWQHTRRVPVRYAQLESRKLIRTSLHTQDYGLALAKAAQIELLQDQEWEVALQSRQNASSPVRPLRISKLKQIAEMRGFTYLPASQVAQLPLSEVCARIEQAEQTPHAIPALLGTEQAPKVTTSNWLETYTAHVEESLANHSPEQHRARQSARMLTIRRFVDVAGELPVEQIKRSHSLAFRKWWQEHLKGKGLSPKTANKDFAYLSGMWRTLAKLEGWEQANPFLGLAFAEERGTRAAFSENWIRAKLLAPGALDGLNDQARDILKLMINTGARPSELVNLKANHIHLEADIPFIQIRGEGRKLKTPYSERDLPLTGCALDAMRRHPEGFDKYQGKAASWSHVVSKYLKDHELLESPKHSPYSL